MREAPSSVRVMIGSCEMGSELTFPHLQRPTVSTH